MLSKARMGPIGVLLVLCLLSATGGGCANDRSVLAQADQFNSGLQPAVMQDSELNDYMQHIGDRIIEAAKQSDAEHFGPKSHFDAKQKEDWMFSNQMKFHLVNSKTLNAFTTGGEHMYIYNELFQQAKSEAELAAVMAHEYGHVYSRHVQKGMDRNTATLLGAGALGAAGYAAGGSAHGQEYAGYGAGLGAAAGQFINMGFTRDDEAQADEVGFHFYTLGGWDPRHFADFFKTMIAKGYDKTPAIASDHPTLASRVEVADKRVQKLGPDVDRYIRAPVADDAQFRRLQQRAAEIASRTPDDKSIANAQQLLQALPRSCWTAAPPDDQIQAQQQLVEKSQPAKASKSSSQHHSRPRDTGDDRY